MGTNDTEQATHRQLLKVPAARARIGVGHSKFYQLVKSGQITVVKIGKSTLVEVDEIERFITSLPRRTGSHFSDNR